MRHSFKVGEILRCLALRGGYRVWQVTGVLLGGVCQENVITLRTLDLSDGIGGSECSVPEELLLRALENGTELIGTTD